MREKRGMVKKLVKQMLIELTLPETNIDIAPENRPPQSETSLPTIHFQGLC